MGNFDKEVRFRLLELDKNQKWLIEELKKRTGLYVDSSYLSKILKEEKNPPRLVGAIREILELKEA